MTPTPTACPFTAAMVIFLQRKMAMATMPPLSLWAEIERGCLSTRCAVPLMRFGRTVWALFQALLREQAAPA